MIAEEEHIIAAFERPFSLKPQCEDCVIDGVLISDLNSTADV